MTTSFILTSLLLLPLAAVPPAKTEPTDAAEAAAKKATAAQIMQKHSVATDDLFTAVTPHLETMQNPNDVHFNGTGYEFLGQQVGEAVEDVLKQ